MLLIMDHLFTFNNLLYKFKGYTVYAIHVSDVSSYFFTFSAMLSLTWMEIRFLKI